MKDPGAIKKLQKGHRFDQALVEYVGLYRDAVREGDMFASGLFMDEIVQTLLLMAGRPVSEKQLRRNLIGVLDGPETGEGQGSDVQIEDDVEVAIRKRFPEAYKVKEFLGSEKS